MRGYEPLGPDEHLVGPDFDDIEIVDAPEPLAFARLAGLPPALAAFLLTVFEGTHGAQSGTLCLWHDAPQGRWCVVLHDRARGLRLFRSGETLPAALHAAGRALTRPDVGWKPDRAGQ